MNAAQLNEEAQAIVALASSEPVTDVPPVIIGEVPLTTEATNPPLVGTCDPIVLPEALLTEPPAFFAPLVEQMQTAADIITGLSDSQIQIMEKTPRPERVKRPLDRDLERQLEVLRRRRNQVLGQAQEIANLDGGVNADEVRTIAAWLDQDFACLITVLEYMPKPEKAA